MLNVRYVDRIQREMLAVAHDIVKGGNGKVAVEEEWELDAAVVKKLKELADRCNQQALLTKVVRIATRIVGLYDPMIPRS